MSKQLPDTQNKVDDRKIIIDKVGIKDIKHPIEFIDKGLKQNVVANFTMTTKLAADVKGTHMSRFIEVLNAEDTSFDIHTFSNLLKKAAAKLKSNEAHIKVSFQFFVRKKAPISGVKSFLDYQVMLSGKVINNKVDTLLQVVVPVKSLCPCSKSISEYGAHNQRSHVTIKVKVNPKISVIDMIKLAENNASSELYAILKREDEKFVTESAYSKPAFVEDMVRDIALVLNNNKDIEYYQVESENFESIHNHSAYAVVEKHIKK